MRVLECECECVCVCVCVCGEAAAAWAGKRATRHERGGWHHELYHHRSSAQCAAMRCMAIGRVDLSAELAEDARVVGRAEIAVEEAAVAPGYVPPWAAAGQIARTSHCDKFSRNYLVHASIECTAIVLVLEWVERVVAV